MRFGLSPARRQPRFSVGTDTSKAGLRCAAASCARNASSSPITQCIASSALWPRSGSDECPDEPCSAIDSIMKPLWAKIGRKSVGSPITANCGLRNVGSGETARAGHRRFFVGGRDDRQWRFERGTGELPRRLDRDREEAFHVARAEAVEAAVAFGQRERALRPVRIVERNRVGVSGQHQSAGAAARASRSDSPCPARSAAAAPWS